MTPSCDDYEKKIADLESQLKATQQELGYRDGIYEAWNKCNKELKAAREQLEKARSALAHIEARCGGPGSELIQKRMDIYIIARDALERIFFSKTEAK